MPSHAVAPSRVQPYPWILHPTIDLLLCAGGLVWILFPFYYVFGGPTGQGPAMRELATLGAVLTYLFGYSHTAATLVRIYRNPDVRRQFAFCAYWVPMGCFVLALVGFFIPGASVVLLQVYILWLMQHYTSQTYGIALIYCYKRGVHLRTPERRVFWFLMYSTAAYAIIRQFTPQSGGGPQYLMQTLSPWASLPAWVLNLTSLVLITTGVLFIGIIIRKAIVERQIFPAPALLLTITSIFILTSDRIAMSLLWIYVPAVFHGSQYLVVTTAYYFKEHGLPDGLPPAKIASLLRRPAGLRYLGLLILGGVIIYFVIPRTLQAVGISYAVAFPTIFAVFNFHHFLSDRAIWRLRDPQVRATLIA